MDEQMARLALDINKLQVLRRVDLDHEVHLAQAVFGNAAGRWFLDYIPSLGGTPVDLILNGSRQKVTDLLRQLEEAERS